MKNIHLVPTDKPGRLHLGGSGLVLCDLVFNNGTINSQHLYITSDEEIKEGDWVIQVNFEKTNTQLIQCVTNFQVKIANDKNGSFTKKKIILTTNQDLIKDGVQEIDDEFLEWFVINPSCKFVEIHTYSKKIGTETDKNGYREMNVFGNHYKIIIPQEEPKQETLEEAAEIEKAAMDKLKSKWSHLYTFGYPQRPFPTNYENDLNNIKVGLYEGAKWQAERMYSEEEVRKIAWESRLFFHNNRDIPFSKIRGAFNQWFEQFKKK